MCLRIFRKFLSYLLIPEKKMHFKKYFLLIAVLPFLPIVGQSEGEQEFRKIENNAFKVGERLTFDVKYGFVTAGVASFHIPKIRKISGREAYHVTFEVSTVSSFDWMYKVRDR